MYEAMNTLKTMISLFSLFLIERYTLIYTYIVVFWGIEILEGLMFITPLIPGFISFL